MTLPILSMAISSNVNPIPVETAVTLYISIGIAIGAGLFVVRRQRRNIVGWIALLAWGGLSVAAIVNALLK